MGKKEKDIETPQVGGKRNSPSHLDVIWTVKWQWISTSEGVGCRDDQDSDETGYGTCE